ncbi:transporter substrate-binding domain-containing protein [Roseibium denhamense]|nr:transporter substrate-binding domain-containing protein [Roseibium denhamense]
MAIMFSSAAVRGETLTFAADEWCPVNCAPGSEKPGYMVEIVTAILEPLGYEIRYQQINWARALLLTRNGQFDGVYAGTPEEAPGFVFPDAPQGEYTIGLFVRAADPWTYTGPQSLEGRSAGLIIDYSYGEAIEADLQRYSEITYTGGARALEQNIRTLDRGRLDLIVEDINSFAYKAAELGLTDAFRLEETFTRDSLYLALSPAKPGSQTIAGHLTAGMQELRSSGELEAIMRKYGLTDWENQTLDDGQPAID